MIEMHQSVIRGVIDTARRASRTMLTEVEAKTVVAEAGLPVVTTKLARSATEAVACAESIGFPVALKLVAPHISHKSDVGGVRLGIADSAAVLTVFTELAAIPGSVIGRDPAAGVSVQAMAHEGGFEFMFGMRRDPQFGPVVLFGMGGTLAEVFRDAALRIAPLTAYDAMSMISEIQASALLRGVRGKPPVNAHAITQGLLAIARLGERFTELKEIDINPVFVYQDRILAADARALLGED